MLEDKIERLTEVMERVCQLLEGGSPAFPKSREEIDAEQTAAEVAEELAQEKAEPEKAEVPKGVTHQDLQDMCMVMVREDRSLKASIKTALADFGATVLTDVPEDKLADLKTKLEALK